MTALRVQGNPSFEADVVFARDLNLVLGHQPVENFSGVSDADMGTFWDTCAAGTKHEKRVCGNDKNKVLAQVIM